MAAPLTAYFDRSELTAPANVMAVAGYMSTAEAWHRFETEWRRALDEYGLEWFHMTDFETRRGPYAGWDNSRRRRFLRRLIGILRIHASVGIGVGLVLPDYNALTEEDRELIGRPYPLCSLKAVAMVFDHIDAGVDTLVARYGDRFRRPAKEENPVDFVFEAGDQDAGTLAEQMRKEAKAGLIAGRIASCSFVDKRELGALQAADLAAYETNKQLVRTIRAEQRAVRKSLTRLITRVRFETAYFNGQTFEQLIGMAKRGQDQVERSTDT